MNEHISRKADKNILYHYTKSENVQLILANETLLMNTFNNTQDPIENKSTTFLICCDDEEQEKYNKKRQQLDAIKKRTKLVCFTQDAEYHHEREAYFPFIRGFLKSRMWNQYADNYKGVCICFDKKKVIAIVKSTFPDALVFYTSVKYTNRAWMQRSVHEINKNNINENNLDFIKKRRKAYFFSKLRDYRDEREFRIIVVSTKEIEKKYIDISNAITSIYVGENCDAQTIEVVRDYCRNKQLKAHKLHWHEGVPLLGLMI